MWVVVKTPRLSFINKEKDFESSLGDFGVRKYEDGLGRFTTCDPLFEKYYGWSPYVYSGNNPINIKDDNGKWWEEDHGRLVRDAGYRNHLSSNQILYLVQGAKEVDKRQKPEEQYLHCMVSPYDIWNAGGDYKLAVILGKGKADNYIKSEIQAFLDEKGDKAFIHLGHALHVIADSYCPDHKWKIYDGTCINATAHTLLEILRANNHNKYWKETEEAVYQKLREVLENQKEELFGIHIQNRMINFITGKPIYDGN